MKHTTSLAIAPFSFNAQWLGKVVFFSLLTWLLGVGLHYTGLAAWMHSFYFVAGERLLNTHDAYYYLISGQGQLRFTHSPLGLFAQWGAQFTGLPLATVAFHIPVLLAALAGLPILYVFMARDLPWNGVLAGFFTVACPAYFVRTQLGCYDNDMLSLLGVTGVISGFILLLAPLCRSQWLSKKNGEATLVSELALLPLLLGGLALGAWMRLHIWLYPSLSPIFVLLFLWSGLVTLFLCHKVYRQTMLLILCCIAIVPMLPILPVWAWLPLLCLPFVYMHCDAKQQKVITLLLFAVTLVLGLWLCTHNFLIASTFIKIRAYLGLQHGITASSLEDPLIFPTTYTTISEVMRLDLIELLSYMGGGAPDFSEISYREYAPICVSSLALLFMCAAFWSVPTWILYLPLVGGILATPYLGWRFALYGAPIFGLGLAWAVYSLARRCHLKAYLHVLCLLTIALFFYILQADIRATQPYPVLQQPYVQGLKDSEELTDPKGILWVWWDYGFIAQYIARRDTIMDGHYNLGVYVYTPSLAMTTQSLAQSSRIMRWVGSHSLPLPLRPAPEGVQPIQLYKHGYSSVLTELRGPQSMELLGSFLHEEPVLEQEAPPQYMAAMWDYLRFIEVISSFGNWNLRMGITKEYRAVRYRANNWEMNSKGIVLDGRQFAVSNVAIVHQGKAADRYSWSHGEGPSLIINALTGEVISLSREGYNASMVQLLIIKPEETPYFELILDYSPWYRLWRAKSASENAELP